MCQFDRYISLSWRQLRPSRLRKAFCLPLNCLKELQKGAFTRKRAITSCNFFIWEIYLHSGANICLPNICSPHLPVNCLSLLWSPRLLPLPLAQNGVYITCLTAFESHIFMGLLYVRSYIHSFSPVNMSFVHLIVRPAKEPRRKEGKFFLPYNNFYRMRRHKK